MMNETHCCYYDGVSLYDGLYSCGVIFFCHCWMRIHLKNLQRKLMTDACAFVVVYSFCFLMIF